MNQDVHRMRKFCSDLLLKLNGNLMTLLDGQCRINKDMDIHEQFAADLSRPKRMPSRDFALSRKNSFDGLD